MALLLRQRGIVRVRPLEGGLAAWKTRGYPVYDARRDSMAGATGSVLE